MIQDFEPLLGEVEGAEHLDIWARVAKILAPRAQVAPSEWIESNLYLTSNLTSTPGPFSCDWKPWAKDALNLLYEEKGKRGIICMKPSQIGWSYGMIATLLYLASTDPGPVLYVTTTEDEAKKFANDVFDGMISDNDEIKEMFRPVHDEKMRQTMASRQYSGGLIDFVGAASERGIISHGRKYLFLDEYQLASLNFPKSSGDLFVTALGRLVTYAESSKVYVYSHPRFPNQDVHDLYVRISDQRSWVFDCPHCQGTVTPRWACVHYERTKGALGSETEIDTDSAVFRCECCGEIITDGQRAQATQPRRRGGSGRFESALEPEVARRRQYIGLAINRLADPDVTVTELAQVYAGCKSSEAIQSFFNKGLGEVTQPAGSLVSEEVIRQRAESGAGSGGSIVVPGGPLGVHFITAGVDVQAPETNPILVVTVHAWCADGTDLMVGAQMVQGWAALYSYLRGFKVMVDDGAGAVQRSMGIRVCGIDCGFATRQVLDACRRTIYSSASVGRPIQLLPLRYAPHIKAAAPVILWPDQKRINPLQPSLGMIEAYDLHRDTFVDRMMRRWIDGRVRALCPMPNDFAAHVTANIRVPKRMLHGWGNGDEMEWERIKNRRDDWAQACAYAEAAAAIKCRLDSIHLVQGAAKSEANIEEDAGKTRTGLGNANKPQWFGRGVGSNWF